MRIAVLSDVHGNHHALDAALEAIRKLKIERIYCAGDIVDPLPGSARVLDCLLERKIPMVRGNHEDYVLRAAFAEKSDLMHSGPNWAPVRQVAASLSGSQLQILKALPTILEIPHPQAGTLVLFHASPNSTQNGWLHGFESDLARQLERLVRESNATAFCCGHWHRQKTERWRQIPIFSNGSVGMALNMCPEVEFITLEATALDGWTSQHHRVPYDSEAAWREYRDSGWVTLGGPTAWLLYDELRLAERRMSPFLAWVQKHKVDAKHSTWPYTDTRELAGVIQKYLQEIEVWKNLKQTLGAHLLDFS